MRRIHIEAEDFRDKAWGVADLYDGTELVLEMTHGYSSLYYRDAVSKKVLTEELFFEEPNHKAINAYCRCMHNVEFV